MKTKWKRRAAVLCLTAGLMLESIMAAGMTCTAQTDQTPTDAVSGDSDASGTSGQQGDKTDKDDKTDAAEGAQSTGSESMSGLSIDNKNRYEGMKSSYARGYVPAVEGNRVVIIVPLLSKRKLAANQMTVALNLGESEKLPFVQKNYEKAVTLGRHSVGKSGTLSGNYSECYLVRFRLRLKKNYYNGSYPVTLSVRAEDEKGNELCQSFTVYVTLKGGKEADETVQPEGEEEKPPLFAPKVMISSYEFSGKTVECGKKFTAKITLRNTSKKEPAKNMMVTVSPGENVELAGKTDSVYVEEIGAGKTTVVSFSFRIRAAAPQGQYAIGVAMEYADSKANSYTVQGSVKVTAGQRVNIEVAPVQMPEEIRMGETVEFQTQVMNTGRAKLYNVRAVLEADGLKVSAPAFIGDMEAGTSMTGSMELTAEGLSGESLYGATSGRITYYYEDEAGNEKSQEHTFETFIRSPFDEQEEKEEDDTGHWWIIMTIIGVFLAESVILFFMKRSGGRQMQGENGNEG